MQPAHDRAGLVGRGSEIAALGAALAAARTGYGGAIVLAGEPGIGKTRLASELSEHASRLGALVLWGRCYEGAGAPAFWPWVQIVRAYVQARGADELRAEIRSGAAELAALAPELLDRLPEIQPSPPIEGEQARFRLFDSLAGALARASQAQALVLILDDLHWADIPSLLLARHLIREVAAYRILIVGTYRESEIGNAHPLTELLADLARLDTGWHLSVGGLATAEVAQLIAQTAGWRPSDALLSALMDATAGNPFFVAQLARLLAQLPADDPRWPAVLPPGIRVAIAQRLQRLGQPCRQLLQLAAVVGREFSLRIIDEVGAMPAAEQLDGLGQALRAHLVSEIPGALGSYRFIHSLVRETIYDALPPAERIHLHRQVGHALAALYAADPGTHLAELAEHFFQAALGGEAAAALDYSIQAAQRSSQLLAYEDAALHYARAIQLLDLGASDPARRCDLLLDLGAVLALSGATGRAHTAYEQAAALARRQPDPARFALATLGRAGTVVTPGVVDDLVVGLLSEALAMLAPTDSVARARVLGRLAMEYRYSPFRERRDTLSAESVAIARRLNDPAAHAATLHARHYALLAPDTLDQRMAVTSDLGRLADTTGNRALLLQSMPWRVADLLDLGHVHAADAAIAETARLAAEYRQPLYAWYVAMFRAQRALMQGQLGEGERLAEAAHVLGRQIQPRTSQIYHAAQLFALRREQGRLPELMSLFGEIIAQYPGMPIFRCFLAHAQLQAGQADLAGATLAALSADHCAALPWDQLWLGGVALLAELCAALGQRALAPALYRLLQPYAQRNVMVGVPICLGAAALYLGMLADLRGDAGAAGQHFADALAINHKLGIKPFLAQAQLAYAGLHTRTGQPEQAVSLIEAARTTAGTEMIALAAQADAAMARMRATPAAPPGGLTARELATLRLIAQGKSTKQIAAELSVSISTVERHITHLYGKIGAHGRADATAFALRYQLV